MQLKFQKTLVPEQDGAAKIPAMCWSPNNAKLAVATADRSIVLFDEQGERRDKFSTKPVDAKYGKKSYVIKAMAFSPDSTRLAVGQSDNIIFVYRIGEGWTDKKVICNKFMQPAAVTALTWPTEQALVVGLADGKVRLSNVKSNKASTLYNTDIFVCSLTPHMSGKSILSGHADGSIVRYSFDSGGAQGKICTHPSPPYALAWTASSVIAAGCDKRVISYNENGRILQQFDYSAENDEREFTTAITNPSGQSVVIGSFDRFRVFNWNQRRGAWDEGKPLQIQYLYTITALSWKPDGSKVVCGTLCGSVRMFDCSLKRGLIRNKFETTHVGPSQVIVKDITTGNRATIRSDLGYEIGEIKVMGRDRYVVAHTSDSLLLADLESGKSSEIPWQSGGNEKFYFDSENVAMIFNAGELTVVEYGINDILGSARTEFMNPHLISVRINERKHKTNEDVKRMAYLVDLKTISILDLRFGSTFGQINHDTKIDWLELNETGRKLLFRDKRYRLTLYNIENEQKTTLLSYASYVQWVPGSDVVVAQSRDNLCVWYNIETPDRVTMFPIKGDIQAVVREEGLTEVIVLEGSMQAAYQLDEGLIEFGTAMDDNDFGRAVTFLEQLDQGADAQAMWRQLAAVALEQRRLHVAQRCYAALGDIARARFLEQTLRIAQQAAKQIGGDGTQFYQVRARLAIMNKEFKDAERIYLEQNCLDEAIEMYQSLHKWDEALELAEARNHPDVESLKAKYYRHLADTGQDEKAGEIKQKENDYMAAVDLYLKGNLPVRAARVVTEHSELLQNTDLVQSIAVALIKNELFEKAGELFEKTKDFDRALECYRRGKALNKAIELARYSFPEQVVKLEEEWGDMLVQQKQMDAAINHFIESGNSLKALDAAIRARQWNKAVQIVDVVDNSDLAKEYYGKIAEHYASIKEYDRAERFYIEAGMNKEAVAMYNRAGKWQEAHRLASEFMGTDETSEMYLRQAAELEESGRFKEAEELYVAVGQPNKAIAMYKKADQHEPMMRLVRRFHGEHVQETHKHLASDLEEKGQLREAEQHYMDAGEWKSAVNMYRAAEQWEDAYRIAKASGGDTAQKQVAYMWAKSLGGDSAVKLLQKFNLLDETIDLACDNGAFDFAFDMCRLGLKAKMPAVHLKYALQLEEEGKLPQAEQQFLQAGKPKEAVLMYVHQQNWDEAQRLAEAHCPEAIPEVYIGQARIAFEQQDYAKAESYLLRANKPDIILRSYKELGMWPDALRICKEYLPARLAELQDEYDNEQLKSGAKGA
uniref:Anaphase-promoting complex subunit 4-like WD40 domain-containing protein n=1 Tax=Plectus sambesii TaxID=2011161 RepID=A0A914XG62_9BILA